MAEQSRESQEHSGVVRVAVELPKVSRFDFVKNNQELQE
jgi:hypothetical protein